MATTGHSVKTCKHTDFAKIWPSPSADALQPYLEWLQYVQVPCSYVLVVCYQFAQVGARGVTFLCASDDNGVGPRQPSCPVSATPAPTSPTLNPDIVIFIGAYPDIAAQGQQVVHHPQWPGEPCRRHQWLVTDRRRSDACGRRLDRGGQVTSGFSNSVAVL